MLRREDLIWEYAEDLEPDEKVLRIADVNPVMDAMEARIKELEFAYESHVNDMALLKARIKELEKSKSKTTKLKE